MVKIYRIREDGSLKDFICASEAEAEAKLKLPNYTADEEIPDLIIEDLKPDEIPEFIDDNEE